MDSIPFPKLFTPLKIGDIQLHNRVVMLPHGTSMVVNGALTDDDIAYYELRARSRPGLMITGASVISPDSTRRGRKLVENYSDHVLEGLAKRAQAVKAHSVAIVGQIIHLGRESIGGESDYPLVAPSAIRSPRDLFPPHELSVDEIKNLVSAFRLSAANLLRTDHNGVEIHGAHGYLVGQFLSPATNHRDDAYGGTPERRMRFLIEVINAIREECGSNFMLGLRLSADEEIADGIEIADSRRIVEALAREAPPDYLSVTLGVRNGYVKDVTQPEATAARAAGILRNASGFITIVGQRITSPALAERILEDGQADAVGFARAFIADGEWVSKAAAGRQEQIRPCIGLNQDCRAFAPHLHCAVNPLVGRETDPAFSDCKSASRKLSLAVIGGGPAGMEVARLSALRGHQVTLYEASDGLGGQFLYASSVPYRSELRRIIDHLQGEIRRLPVNVILNKPIYGPGDLADVYDAAVIATGAIPQPIDAAKYQKRSMRWFEILSEGVPEPYNEAEALVVDDGSGFWWTYGVANALVEAGWQLTIATPSTAIASAIPSESLPPLLARLGEGKTRYLPLTDVMVADDEGVELINLASGVTDRRHFNLVVAQTGRASVAGPFDALSAAGLKSYRIGDCISPRRISHALFEAHRLGLAL